MKLFMGDNCVSCGKAQNGSSSNIMENRVKSCFFSLPPKQFSLLATLIGILLIDNLDANQQNSLGNFIVSIGQGILTAVSQQALLESNEEKNDHIKQQIKMLKKQICSLEDELNS
ncbi:MAG TPA: hypothetical protein PK733_14650 [Clostridiales bacterium]|nr:hypothetical protein [Clostridiales bacterium]